MSATMPSEYEVFKMLRECTISGLTKFGVLDGLDVRRFAQANIANGDKLVLLNLIGSERIGWQAFRYANSPLSLKRTDEWIEEQEWQFSFIKLMRNSDTVTTVTADDLCNICIAWFNGEGNLLIRSKGIACLPIDPHSVMVYNDESDLYQRRPVFTMNLQVPKNFTANTDGTEILNVTTHPV